MESNFESESRRGMFLMLQLHVHSRYCRSVTIEERLGKTYLPRGHLLPYDAELASKDKARESDEQEAKY